MAQYVGILDGGGDVWGVRIPDLPGCYGGGPTPEAAIADATSAAIEYAAHMAAARTPVAAPRTLSEILADEEHMPDTSAGETGVMIPVVLDRGRSVRANLSLDAGMLEAIDEAAARLGITRSSFVASAALEKIRANQ